MWFMEKRGMSMIYLTVMSGTMPNPPSDITFTNIPYYNHLWNNILFNKNYLAAVYRPMNLKIPIDELEEKN